MLNAGAWAVSPPAPAALDPLREEVFPTEQARLIPLPTEHADIGTDVLKLRFRDKRLAQMVTEAGTIVGILAEI